MLKLSPDDFIRDRIAEMLEKKMVFDLSWQAHPLEKRVKLQRVFTPIYLRFNVQLNAGVAFELESGVKWEDVSG